MTGTPATKISQLGDRVRLIESDLRRGAHLNDIAWTKLKNDAFQLYHGGRDRLRAAVLLAVLEGFHANVSGVVGWILTARKLNIADHVDFENAIIAAERVCETDLVLDLIQEALDKKIEISPKIAFNSLVRLGRFRQAMSYLEQSSVKLNEVVQDYICDVKFAIDYLDEIGISDRDFGERFSCATKFFLSKTNLPIMIVSVEVTEVGILVGLPYGGSIEDGVALDWELANVMIESFADPLDEHVSFITLPYEALNVK